MFSSLSKVSAVPWFHGLWMMQLFQAEIFPVISHPLSACLACCRASVFAFDLIPCAMADYGVEKAVSIQGKEAADISDELQKLIKIGETMPR